MEVAPAYEPRSARTLEAALIEKKKEEAAAKVSRVSNKPTLIIRNRATEYLQHPSRRFLQTIHVSPAVTLMRSQSLVRLQLLAKTRCRPLHFQPQSIRQHSTLLPLPHPRPSSQPHIFHGYGHLPSVQNMPPQFGRPGQSQARTLASLGGPQSNSTHTPCPVGGGAGTPPPPSAGNGSGGPAQSPNTKPLLGSSTLTRPNITTAISSARTQQIARHLSSSSVATMASQYSVRKVGAPYTLEHRVYIEKDGVPVSPFHDIPLYANAEQTILNMVVEIPRWTNAKQEISKEELLNPIKQDTKKGKLRFVRNCFPHKGYLWNYGAFPQTWEDPNSIHPETKAKGDNDPLDVCEIGELVGYTGQVKQVKVLGVMALLDEEETDWKVIVIDVNDPLAPKLNDVEDVERHLPGLIRATNEWFRIYKIPDGKPENQFAFTGECKNKRYAMDVVRECNEAWERLITGKTAPGGVSTTNVTVQHSSSRVAPDQLPPLPPNENLPPAPIDSSIDKWFFISGASA
ncbi:pyrophosphatase-domain-containing protein [Neurospora crassa]|nr:pyrophosphatase-domain-containing protein [Neurospora crassa]